MTDEDVLPEKELIEKAARIKIKLTKQTDFVGKQYQGLDKIHEFDKKGLSESLIKYYCRFEKFPICS